MEGNLICGCVVDGDNIPCVFDDPDYTVLCCNFAKTLHEVGKGRDDCEYWKPLTDEEHAASHLAVEIAQLTAERDRYKAALERVALESSSSGGDLWEIHEVSTDALEYKEAK